MANQGGNEEFEIELSALEKVTIIHYKAIRRLLESGGRELTFKLLGFLNPNHNISRFREPEYLSMTDRDLAWELIEDCSEFNEDYIGIRDAKKFKQYEEEHDIDLYELFRDTEIS